jgi:hypothetical protein
MPPDALALALAASIYPPAVAAVIALGRGADVRMRVCAFVLASLLVTYAVGVLILFVLVEAGVSGSRRLTPGAGVDIALGVLLLGLAVRLRLRRPSPLAGAIARVRKGRGPTQQAAAEESSRRGGPGDVSERRAAGGEALAAEEPSKIERYLHSRRLAFALGIVLYVLPSPIYLGAVKAIADANTSRTSELMWLVAVVGVMLWMIELPMLMLLAVPGRAAATLERTNRWFARNGRGLAIFAAGGAGIYLMVKGIVQLS